MLNLNSVMIGSKQSKALAAFYEKVIGKPADMIDGEHGFCGWQVGSGYFSVLDHSEMGGKTKDPGRILLNFETSPGCRGDSSALPDGRRVDCNPG